MAYRGEDIKFRVKGDDKINLDVYDFKLLIHPDGKFEDYEVINKSAMTKIEDNHYEAEIDFNKTKTMPLGSYTIEVLIIEETSERVIYLKRGVFPLYDSASKNEA